MVDQTDELVVEKDNADGGLLVTISVSTVLAVLVIVFVFMGLWERRHDQLVEKKVTDRVAAGYTKLVNGQRELLHKGGVDESVPVPEGQAQVKFHRSIDEAKKRFLEKN